MNKEQIIEYFSLFSNHESDGLECIFSEEGKEEVFERLKNIDSQHLSKVQLNQLLIISGLTGISFSFFKYYWLTKPDKHPYQVEKLDDFEEEFIGKEEITSLQHLRWGLRRIYTDALLYYGNITNGFNHLNTKNEKDLIKFFESRRFKTETIISRGQALDF
ncbi:MAG: hypothetical protein HYR78_08455, partial [Nitrospirae bacterium]|nr:hypothetical protein [Nitrospirota bacterium]